MVMGLKDVFLRVCLQMHSAIHHRGCGIFSKSKVIGVGVHSMIDELDEWERQL